MSEKIAIVGNKDSIFGFKALGFECFPVEKVSDALDVIKGLFSNHQGYAIIYLTDDFASKMDKELDEIKKDSPGLPVLIVIPSHKGSLNLEIMKVRRMVEKALGTDILKDSQ